MSPDRNDPLLREKLSEARAGVDWFAKRDGVDFHIEERVGTILRVGVNTSSVLLFVGLLLALTTSYSSASTWLMTAGLVLLMATPIARVAISVVEYAAHHDWPFFVLTGVVLLELCAGIVAALVFHRRL